MSASGRKARDAGIAVAVAHADDVTEGWSSLAYFAARNFIRYYGNDFVTEQVRAYAAKKGLPSPPDSRAWGGVMLRLAKEGRIAPGGYSKARNRCAHMRPVTIWKVAA